ncbi:MAG TPA: alpha/beta hydrolase [Chthoniobacterales bacterium]|nr:alpha/beta hydrolase [Chthoniobacterales bacterium]
MLRTLQTDTLEIAYEECGDPAAKPVVLLHGFPDDARAWDRVVEKLAVEGFRTIAPYLRGFGPTRFLRSESLRSGQQAALAYDLHGLVSELELIQPILVGYDWGARAACTTAVLWPARVGGLVPIGGYNVQDIGLDRRPASARNEYMAWYQWYFHTERGRAGLEENRREICRLLWELWSPDWKFTDAEFDETAASFDNPDFVNVVIHSYRHRYGAVHGDPQLDLMEQRLSGQPRIHVPAIVLHGESDGVHPPARSEGHGKFFSGYYERRLIPRAGHLFPREAPDAVVAAVRELARLLNAAYSTS